MKTTITMVSTLLAAGVSLAQTVTFDKDKTGAPPGRLDLRRDRQRQASLDRGT